MAKNILCFVLSILLLAACKNDQTDKEFSSIEWKDGDIRTRGKMINHLIDSTGLNGRNKVEIIDLLGLPDDSTSNTYSYMIDLEEIFTYDLILFFDSSDYVEDYIIDD